MKDDFVSSGRSVSDLKTHLVLTTKYRRKIFTEFLEHIKQFYSKSVLWHSACLIASCGGVTVSVLKRYIEEQGR
jgi:REP element-mobilizing transposase RayT